MLTKEECKDPKYLNCFWVPGLTPNINSNKIELPTDHTYCPGCNQTLRRKDLIPCKFTLNVHDESLGELLHNDNKINKNENIKNKNDEINDEMHSQDNNNNNNNTLKYDQKFMCPSCRKTLTDTIQIGCIKICGHIICFNCITQFCAKSKTCVVCDEPCKKKDIILLKSGGTGFAQHGNQYEATKKGLAFQ